MYRLNVLLIFAAAYFGLNVVFGYLHCEENFCPGDRENDYVYTVKDSDGKTWYMENGKAMSEEEYRATHDNLYTSMMEEKERNGKK